MKLFAATIALIAAAIANAQSTWTDCAPGSDFNVTSMTLSPEPFCAGESVCVTMVGTLSAPITDPSTATMIGTYFGVTDYSYSVNLCALVSCPVAQNTTTLEFCFPVPSVVFPLPLDFTISSTNGNGDTLFCQAGTATPSYCSS